jgi:hypothetical protein
MIFALENVHELIARTSQTSTVLFVSLGDAQGFPMDHLTKVRSDATDPTAVVTSHQAMAQRSVEGISHQTVAHGVQAGQPASSGLRSASMPQSHSAIGGNFREFGPR